MKNMTESEQISTKPYSRSNKSKNHGPHSPLPYIKDNENNSVGWCSLKYVP